MKIFAKLNSKGTARTNSLIGRGGVESGVWYRVISEITDTMVVLVSKSNSNEGRPILVDTNDTIIKFEEDANSVDCSKSDAPVELTQAVKNYIGQIVSAKIKAKGE